MKLLVSIVRVLVGLLFIFSGLIKANDPLGLSYKMQEFFDLWHWSALDAYSLWFSILIIAFEIIAGFALLLGWQMRLFSWLLLLLVIFFTFLTGYAYLSDKFKNCGCFGDCIPISPLTSFTKDVILTILIAFLFSQQKKIRPLFSSLTSVAAILLVSAFSFGIQWYMLRYLPVLDCLPFKKGNNIAQQMQMPADAVPDSIIIHFVYDRQGKEVDFTADNFPIDFNDSLYHFKKRYDKIVRKGKNNEPPIKSFALVGADGTTDSSTFVLSQPFALLAICEDPSTTIAEWARNFHELYDKARKKNIPVYFITSVRGETLRALAGAGCTGVSVLSCDNVTIRSAARTNPCFYILQYGNIVSKESYKRLAKISVTLDQIPAQPDPKRDSTSAPGITTAPK
jgi:uncharacterized membrane protein YphA (DoxX/SURF4 family)